MKLFNRSPKIKKGHSFIEYISRYGKQYINLQLNVESNATKLKNNKTYWEIDGKYYEVNHSRFLKVALCSLGALSIAINIFVPIYFTVIAPKDRYHDYSFKYWNNSESLNSLKKYVKEVTNPNNKTYIPQIDRIATFDMDGTLFGERSEIYIEWMFYKDYLEKNPIKATQTFQYSELNVNTGVKAAHSITLNDVKANIETFMNTRVSPTQSTDSDGNTYKIDLEMREAIGGALLFSNITIEQYIHLVDEYLENNAHSFTNLKFKDMFYKPMIEVVEFLQLNNFDVYIVSGTDRFMVRDIVNKHITIPSNKVIGMDVNLTFNEVDKQVYRGSDLKYKNVKSVKVELISQEIAKKPVLSFGNSSGDVQMHDFALNSNQYKSQAYMVLADDNEREFGYDDATIASRKAMWEGFGYNIFSMKDDFKTIYGDNVAKKVS